MTPSLRSVAAPWVLVLAGCAAVPEDSGFVEVQSLTGTRLEQRIHWRQGTPEDQSADAEIEELLSSPLSVDAAVQIALLENRSLQVEYERLGIAQADLVQAGLLRNPVFSASVRFPDRSPSAANLELGVVQDFLDILLRPARRGIAEAQFHAVKLSVAARVVDFAADIRRAYFVALGAQQVAGLRELVVDAAGASAELAQRLHEAGNISDLQLANEVGLYENARVAWARADADRLAAREDLTALMGLWGPRASWTLPDGLPDIPDVANPVDDLEARAISSRLDLAAARMESEALAQALGVARDWRFLTHAEIGLDTERDTDGQWVTGPEVALALPIFDQGQAGVARHVAELRRADQQVIALAVQVRSEVRAARNRAITMQALAEHYRTTVIPFREAAVALTQQEHDFMLVGAFELIAAKQAEYDAYQEYVEVVRDYWIARAELARALGGDLDRETGPSESPAPPAVEQEHDHRAHGGP